MSQLRLQKRDDPLAIAMPQSESEDRDPGVGETEPSEVVRGDTPRRAVPSSTAADAPTRRVPVAAGGTAEGGYDQDRLEQTGWRIYESLLEQVRARADELCAAGIPTSAAALAAATLHSHLPRTVEEGTEIMRAYRQATAGRQRVRRVGMSG
ncbi:MAG: hypothetical protein ACLP50_25730 [Solirubrobacteraceae bacterium]